MVLALLIGLVVGIVLAIPPGPIGLASVRMAIRDGWVASVKLAIGAGVFDALYGALAMVATAAAVQGLSSLQESTPWATLGMQVLIIAVMITFGIHQIRVASREQQPSLESTDTVLPQKGLLSWFRTHGPFFLGIGFALANLANPTFIPALAATATFIQQLAWFDLTLANRLLFALGFGAGNVLWLLTLVRLVLANRERMSPTFLKRVQQVSGWSLIGFGALYGVRIILTFDWNQLVR